MLRRNFLKASTLIAGGILFIPDIPYSFEPEETAPRITGKRSLNLHGHPRSGCASRPELAPLLERGFAAMPPS